MENEISEENIGRDNIQNGDVLSSGKNGLNQQDKVLSPKIEDRYRSFFETIEQAYFEIDKSGGFSFFNDHLSKMLGCSNEELAGKKFTQFLDKDDDARVKAVFKEIFETDRPKSGLVFKIIRKDGSKRQIGASICLDIDRMNQKIGFKGIARDISERVNCEDHFNHNRRMESIGQLASGIAHEINTPIQYIGDNIHFTKYSFRDLAALLKKTLSFVQIAKTGSIEESVVEEIETMLKDIDADYLLEEVPKAIEQSIEGLFHVSEIVSAMKQFCHPGIEEKKAADLNTAIKNVITVARNEWKYVADVTTEFDTNLPPVSCRLGEINQVVLNLIINAVHAINDVVGQNNGEKGTIKVTTSHDTSWAEIRVSDSGTGIPEDIRSRVFDPFFTTKEVGKGTGQGLALSHSLIVNNHSGTLNFETEIGKGTTMIVRLPLRSNDEH
jgi:PAS domain S-box-containing protein